MWNLDEAGFKIGESATRSMVIAPLGARNNVTHETSENVTLLEIVSADGVLGDPLFNHRGKHLMEAWFPRDRDITTRVATSPTSFINGEIFAEWFSDYFPSSTTPARWKLLLLDGHFSHTREEFLQLAIDRQIIPLFFPSHLTNVLQPLDRVNFGIAKSMHYNQVAMDFINAIVPSKRQFFENYLELRPVAFSRRNIIGGWTKAGLVPFREDVALQSFRDQMNQNLIVSTPVTDTAPADSLTFANPHDPTLEEEVPLDVSPPPTPPPRDWRSTRASLLPLPKNKIIAGLKTVWFER